MSGDTPDLARIGAGLHLRRLWELREFDGLRFAIRHDDAAEFADAVRKLRAGPILDPEAHRRAAGGRGRAAPGQ